MGSNFLTMKLELCLVPFLVTFIDGQNQFFSTQWRPDGRCGAKHPLADGVTPGQCNPAGDGPRQGPCCSSRGFCGNTDNHCDCGGCVDYSKQFEPLTRPRIELAESQRAVEESGPEAGVESPGWGGWLSGWVKRWESVSSLLPSNVTDYVEEAAVEGFNVVSGLYNDTRGQLVDKAEQRVDQVTSLVQRLIGKLEEIYLSASNIVRQERVFSELEINRRNAASNLTGIKQGLDELKDQVERENLENRELEGVEGAIQQLITTARELLTIADDEAEVVWSKLKQLELEFFQASEILAGSSGELRKQVMTAFREMEEELKEASPALRSIIDAVLPK